MRVVILSAPPDLSAYLGEILSTWGLALYEVAWPDALGALDPADAPVVVCPSSQELARHAESLVAYVRRGGTLVCSLPEGELAEAAGLQGEGDKTTPLRLRVTERPAAGLAGEQLPIVGRARTYRCAPHVRVLAYLCHPDRYHGESPGLTETALGEGRIVAFAFDLPLCVLMLRQGDPDRAEVLPEGDTCARPSHLAADLGPYDSGWIPFADLLARLLVDLVRARFPAPVPLLSHLPGEAAGMVLYSGDEDNAEVAWNDEELDYVAAAGGRMNLYIVPTGTKSTRADVERYRASHDVGPHPNLRNLDGRPVAERLAELERHIRLFQDMFGVSARSLRNHCAAWAGYTEPVEVMERLGVRMDANYLPGCYMRARHSSPYAAFGAAMPMRFCRPDGRLLDVFQQHTHLADDVMFFSAEYSFKFSPSQFEVQLRRILSDVATRFHVPYSVLIHPSNWVKFSRPQGQEILRQAAGMGLPVWSLDQWCRFWEARDTWRFRDLAWDGARLIFTAQGERSDENLRLSLPTRHAGRSLLSVRCGGEEAPLEHVTRYYEQIALVPLPAGATTLQVRAVYS